MPINTETFLNVRGEDHLLSSMHEVYASLFNDRAISYRVHSNFDHNAVALSVGGGPGAAMKKLEGSDFAIDAIKDIKAGEELFYDYGLVIDERYTAALKKRFECRCGTRGCRGTMLSPKRTKFRKMQKGNNRGLATAGSDVLPRRQGHGKVKTRPCPRSRNTI